MKVVKKKYPYGVDEEFLQEVESSTTEVLKDKLAKQQAYIEEVQAFLKCDYGNLDPAQHAGAQKLKEMKEAYEEAAGPSRDAKKASKNRIKYIMEQLRKNGAV
jgi:hypothetical protein